MEEKKPEATENKKNEKNDQEEAKVPARETINYNCTVQVSKQAALAMFDQASERNKLLVETLVDMSMDSIKSKKSYS